MTEPKRVLVSQDLSGVGAVSLGVAWPLLAACGLNPAVLPTALLSTHTGFADNTFFDLAPEMPGILAHWQSLDLQLDALYLGYLGHNAASVWAQWLPQFDAVPLRLVDPVMADHGRLYRGFTQDDVRLQQTIAAHATLLTPNITEAQLLLDQPPVKGAWAKSAATALATSLAARFNTQVVITGVPLQNGTLGIIGAAPDQAPWLHTFTQLPGDWFGTGDVFASLLVIASLRGLTPLAASKLAEAFVSDAIARTLIAGSDPRLGVDWAGGLPALLHTLTQLDEGVS